MIKGLAHRNLLVFNYMKFYKHPFSFGLSSLHLYVYQNIETFQTIYRNIFINFCSLDAYIDDVISVFLNHIYFDEKSI